MSYSSPDDALARIDRDIAAAQERAERARAFRQEVDRLRGTATVDGVTATVDITGVLSDLRLPRQLAYRDPDSLAASVLAAIRAAHAEVAATAREAAEREFGADSATATAFANELSTRFADPGAPR